MDLSLGTANSSWTRPKAPSPRSARGQHWAGRASFGHGACWGIWHSQAGRHRPERTVAAGNAPSVAFLVLIIIWESLECTWCSDHCPSQGCCAKPQTSSVQSNNIMRHLKTPNDGKGRAGGNELEPPSALLSISTAQTMLQLQQCAARRNFIVSQVLSAQLTSCQGTAHRYCLGRGAFACQAY